MEPEIRSQPEQSFFFVRGWLFLGHFGRVFAGRVCVARVSLHYFSLAGAALPSTTMQGEREAMPPGHVSGAEAAAMAQQPPVGTVVQAQAQVVQPAAVTVVQPAQQPVGQVVYQQQPVQPVGQVVYQQPAVQPPAVVVQQPQHAGPHQEKFIGIATISIAALLCVCGCWPCAWIPFVAPCDERSVYPPQQQQQSVVTVQQPQPGVVVQQQPKY